MRKFALRELEVEINGRLFRMREHTGPLFERYIRQLNELRTAAETLKTIDNPVQAADFTLATNRQVATLTGDLLGQPIDGVGDLPADFFGALNSRFFQGILATQDELNTFGDIMGKSPDGLAPNPGAETSSLGSISQSAQAVAVGPTGPIFADQ